MRRILTYLFFLTICFCAFSQNKVILVAGSDVSKPVIVKLNNGTTYRVYSTTEVSGNQSVSSATDSKGNKLQWKFSHSGGTSGGRSYSVDTYTFYSSSQPDYSTDSSSSSYNKTNTTPSRRINRSGRDRVETYGPISPELIEINDIWDIKYNNKPIVIEVYSFTNPECKEYSDIFDDIVSEYKNKIDFYKININKRQANEFYHRYNMTTTPATVFLWDPKGDASVKESVKFGALNYSELQDNIQETLNKHFSEKNTYDTYDSNLSEDGNDASDEPKYITVYISDSDKLYPCLGVWKGKEDGLDSEIKFWIEEGCVAFTGKTDSPQRISVYNTPYWWIDNFKWDEDNGVLEIIEVTSSSPVEFYSMPEFSDVLKKGIFKTKIFKLKDNKIHVDVKEYVDQENWQKKNISKQYSIEYEKVSE